MISNIADAEVTAVAQVIVRGLEDEVKQRLQRRARRHGRSMEDEIRHILRSVVAEEGRAPVHLGTAATHLFRGVGLRADLPELKGHPARPPRFRR